jgi:hypothetical protein
MTGYVPIGKPGERRKSDVGSLDGIREKKVACTVKILETRWPVMEIEK